MGYNKRSIIWLISSDEFASTVASSNSIASVLRAFSLSTDGGNVATVRRRIVYDKLNADHINSGRNSNKNKRWITKRRISNEELFCANSTTPRNVVRKRVLHDNLVEYKCTKCGINTEWNGEPISLVLDHINGICNDHRLCNLRFLCPNCNSQTSTFSGRNVRYKASPVV